MWGCDYGPISGGWWGGFFPGSFLSLLIWSMMILFLIYLGIRLFKALSSDKPGPFQDRVDSLAILKTRFAKGDVSKEEYHRMKQIISGA